ncbi:MAG: efflux RND transporter periplasmic adaptor subunit [Luteitalea sp.]|nr:efflux RND transporter periplasmic adaptor subunit [Luteitalea sp.]
MTRLTCRLVAVLALILVSVPGCGRQSPKSEESGQLEPSAAEDETPHAAEGAAGTMLRLGADTLRDLRLTTTAVESRSGRQRVDALGELHANQEAYAEVHPPLSGRVVKLLAAPGARVRAGAGLAVIQSSELGRARAAYLSSSARLLLAQQNQKRKRGLAAERIVPVRDVQEAEAETASAQADVRASRATLSALGVSEEEENDDASHFTLRALVSGVVLSRGLVLGQMADVSSAAFTIADLSTLWLTVHVFERDALRVEARAPARVTFPALPGRTFEGRVTFVGREVDASSGTIPIRIVIENKAGSTALTADELLRPGMSASAELQLGDATLTILSVPTAAVQRLGDAWVAFVPRDDGRFEMRDVGRGRDLGGEVEILSGLRTGERVVVQGAFVLKAEAEKMRGGGDPHDH